MFEPRYVSLPIADFEIEIVLSIMLRRRGLGSRARYCRMPLPKRRERLNQRQARDQEPGSNPEGRNHAAKANADSGLSQWPLSCVTICHFLTGNMRRVPTTFLPPIALDARAETSMYRQLYEWFRLAITSGQIRPGQRIPSTRSLATELKISRIPVSNAYDQLLAEGYLETFPGAGTCVSRSLPDDTLKGSAAKDGKSAQPQTANMGTRRISRRGMALTQLPTQSWLNIVGAFRVSLPALDYFPIGVWSKLVARHARSPASGIMGYGD